MSWSWDQFILLIHETWRLTKESLAARGQGYVNSWYDLALCFLLKGRLYIVVAGTQVSFGLRDVLAWEALSIGVEPEIRGFVVSLPLSFKVGQKRVA